MIIDSVLRYKNITRLDSHTPTHTHALNPNPEQFKAGRRGTFNSTHTYTKKQK